MTADLEILVDADACPVKDETYKVALRYQVPVLIVANQRLRIPQHDLIVQLTVGDGFDEADDVIAERANDRKIVITGDILLADRCLKAGAAVIAPNGEPFSLDSIGAAIAARAIMADLRAGAGGEGAPIGGPAPFTKKDRSRFLSALDEAVTKAKRRR